MRISLQRLSIVLATASLAAVLHGCSGDNTSTQVAAVNTSNIQRLANMYSAFQNYKGGRGPKDEAEFKAFIKNFDAPKLSMMGIDPNNLNALFTSERDSKPFKVRYKVGGGRGAVAPVIFEQVGSEGQKQVGFTGNSKVESVDDTSYAQLWSGKSRPSGEPQGGPQGGRPNSGIPVGAPKGPPGK